MNKFINDNTLTTFVVNEEDIVFNDVPPNVELLIYKSIDDVSFATGKYISFVYGSKNLSQDYFQSILKKINEGEFDCCFLNYKINYDYDRDLRIRSDIPNLESNIPNKNAYIWNFVFNKEKFLELIKFNNNGDYTDKVKDLFKVRKAISDVVYYHDKNEKDINIAGMSNVRKEIYYKNIIYMGSFCNGLFNGYITWLIEIGKAFPNFDITILYTKINETTRKRFSEYFNCVEYSDKVNYICDNLITTYSTYFYPINIYRLHENSIFIHGNMSDYEASARFRDDIYDRYIAVSKISRDRAHGYFPTDNIEYIYNPYTYDKNKIKPHLSLVSALRNAPEKGMERIKKAAGILDRENIPYTWQVFTDVVEQNQGGLIFRHCVTNTIDYVADADYLVQFSRTEALSYSLTEGLCSKVKVITTDIPAIKELNVIDGVNGVVVPMDYFDEGNEDLLRDKLLWAYKNKDLKFDYSYDYSRFSEFNNVFSK